LPFLAVRHEGAPSVIHCCLLRWAASLSTGCIAAKRGKRNCRIAFDLRSIF